MALLGLAIAGIVFRHNERVSLSNSLTLSDVHLTQQQQDIIRSLLSDPNHAKSILGELPIPIAAKVWPMFENAFMRGYSFAFAFLLGLSLVAFIVVAVMMKNIAKRGAAP